MSLNGWVERKHCNAGTTSRAEEMWDLLTRIGHSGDTAIGNVMDSGVYPELSIISRDVAVASAILLRGVRYLSRGKDVI